MGAQALLFLQMVLAGAAIGVLYDTFRVARKCFPHPGWLVQAEDLLFWLVTAFGLFYVLLHYYDGQVRLYALLGAALGMVLYFATLSPPLRKVAVAVVRFLQKVLFAAARILCWPVRVLLRLLRPPIRFLRHHATKQRHRAKRKGGRVLRSFRRQVRIVLRKK